MKNKLFTADQARLEEVILLKQKICLLENHLKEEQRKNKEQSDAKQKKIEEFERDIEMLLQEYAQENDRLKHELELCHSTSRVGGVKESRAS